MSKLPNPRDLVLAREVKVSNGIKRTSTRGKDKREVFPDTQHKGVLNG